MKKGISYIKTTIGAYNKDQISLKDTTQPIRADHTAAG
jgi:hypothetical protein